MPELAEVEFYRKRWDAGLRQTVGRVELHAAKRVFRGTDTRLLVDTLHGARLLASQAHGKQMLFRFSRGSWLGIHLGMSGRLSLEPVDFAPGKHDHLTLRQRTQTLVFSDPRMFGRVLFHRGRGAPGWWAHLPPAISSEDFTLERVRELTRRRARLPVKALLLMQSGFPGVGNWMADEILWRARIDPRRPCGSLSAPRIEALWRATRAVCEGALSTVGIDYADPPRGWLFHERWKVKGVCPRDGRRLKSTEVGGRTTRWCGKCQR